MPFPLCACVCLTIVSLILYTAASVSIASKNYYKSIQNIQVRNKGIQREIKSLKAFGIQVGFYKNVSKISICMLYLTISNNIVTLLVALPE